MRSRVIILGVCVVLAFLATGCRERYQEEQQIIFPNLGTIEEIVESLGENGYVALDRNNQVDMVNSEKLIEFCGSVEQRRSDQIVVITVAAQDSYAEYHFHTQDGNVAVELRDYSIRDGVTEKNFIASYTAQSWLYADGYLMFSGTWFSEQVYVLTGGGVEEYTAFRIEPLGEELRELNRKYLLPVGFEKNNCFCVNWSQEDYSNLNFYDLFDLLYEDVYGKKNPYKMDDNLSVGAVYQIPREEFERVITRYIEIEGETLQRYTVFNQSNQTYEYRPRGFEEIEYPEYPFSEVIGYTEKDDTITLRANVVYPKVGVASYYEQEVVIRRLDNGRVRYVSNTIVTEGEIDPNWHTDRLTLEEWQEVYGNNVAESSEHFEDWFFPQVETELFTKEEKRNLDKMAMEAAQKVSGSKNISTIQCQEIVEQLGEAGYTSVCDDYDMRNPEPIRDFYEQYLNGNEGMFMLFKVSSEGLLQEHTFIYRDGKLQTYYAEFGWNESGVPEKKTDLISDVAEIKLTAKGYFIYSYKVIMEHASLRQCFRITPLSEECRKLTKKYVQGLSYVNYNVLGRNWDQTNVEDILMPCMFEDIYRMYTGENWITERDTIPAETFEQVMTTFFPVSVEQLRNMCGYTEKENTYPYEMIFATQYPPKGEVIDYSYHADGTITLVVDGLWIDYNSDCAFCNTIVVQPLDGDKFRYLSNTIEQRELVLEGRDKNHGEKR